MEHEAFLTVAEIAAELRIHPVTVQKLYREGVRVRDPQDAAAQRVAIV